MHIPIIRNFNKRKVHSYFIDKMLSTNLADMQLINKFNKEFRFLLCVIEIYSKYAWIIPLKDEKEVQLLVLFRKFKMNQNANQIKYGLIKTINSIIDQWNYG